MKTIVNIEKGKAVAYLREKDVIKLIDELKLRSPSTQGKYWNEALEELKSRISG